MKVLVNVVNQQLRLATSFQKLVEGTQNFIHFKFVLDGDWKGLRCFAQFIQNGIAYNVYLDDDDVADLPPEIVNGKFTLMLYGNGETDGNNKKYIVGTSNYLTLTVEKNILKEGTESTEISPTLYQQLVEIVNNYTGSSDTINRKIDTINQQLTDKINTNNTNVTNRINTLETTVNTKIDLKAELSALNQEISRAKGVEGDLSDAINTKAEQDDLDAVEGRVTAIENGTNYDEVIKEAVTREIAALIASGELDNMSIADGSLSRAKVDADFEATLKKADSAMQASVYDPNGYGSREYPVDPYTFAQTQDSTRIQALRNGDGTGGTEFEVSDGSTSVVYSGLNKALNGVLTRSELYANGILANYSPFYIKVVDAIDLTSVGADRTFYLVPKESGDGYEKWWYVTDENHNGRWDKFGSSTTQVVTALDPVGDPDADYILAKDGDYQYYKYINGNWVLIAGSNSVVITLDYALDFKGEGTPYTAGISTAGGNEGKHYLDVENMQVYLAEQSVDGTEVTWTLFATLVSTPNDKKDYFLRDSGNTYFHLRYEGNRFYMVGSDAYSRDEIDLKFNAVNNSISENANKIIGNAQNITSVSRAVDKVAQDLANLDVEGVTYYAALSTEDNKTYTYTLYEVDGDEETVKSQFNLPATGGGGGSSSTTTLVVDRITPSPVICTPTDKVILEIDFSSTDSDGEIVDGTYSIRQGSSTVMSGNLVQGRNSFDITEYCNVGTQKFTLTVTDEGGSVNVKTWTVQIADVRIESSFNDRYTYPIGSSINFTYTPYGSVPKTVHFKLDGVELDPVSTTSSGTLQSYTLSPQSHGAHLLECWITATVNNRNIETDHIFKDIIWYDENSTIPVIGCIYRYDHYGEVEARQYNTTTIPYVVYDPRTTTPNVTLEVDGETYSTLRLTNAVNTWAYKSEEIAVHVLKIKCGEATLEIHMNIVELGYDIEPVTANLEFDFNPVGYSNSSENRLWVDANHPNVKLSVSENFDWSNGGYQLDSNGNQYFCVKAGTRATISYNLFATDPKQSGAEFKLIFKTVNVRDSETTFLSCLPTDDAVKVGLQMKAHTAYITTSTDSLFQPYSEEDIIEFEYNINTLDTEDSNATSYIMTYEDGVGSRALIYNDSHRIYQYQPVPITIGSDDCDVFIYRMKAYSSSLTDTNILANFVADSLDSDTMIARYERNQIYDENGNLTPDSVANACPNLKVIKIECPHFTNDKKDYVKYTNVECIHKNGDPILDNWKFVNAYHAGQGTTSNEYGYAGRNIDIIFGFDGKHQVTSKIPLDPNYITELTLGDGTKYSDGSGKVTLTRTSVPNNWFNIKVKYLPLCAVMCIA